MKTKKIKFVIVTIIILSIICINVSAKNYSINIENVDSKLIKKQGENTQTTFLHYKITVTLKNTGTEKSDNLTVVIIEDDATKDYPGTKTRRPTEDMPQVQLEPGESYNFIFGETTEWMIQGDREHEITIIVYPNNNESATPLVQTTHILNPQNNNQDSIPGFETSAIIIAVLAFIFIYYKKRKV